MNTAVLRGATTGCAEKSCQAIVKNNKLHDFFSRVLLLRQKYEEKRRQYLAAKQGSSSDAPRVHFQDSQHTQDAHVASGRLSAIAGDVPFLGGGGNASAHHQRHEDRDQPNDPSTHVEKHPTARVREPIKTSSPTTLPSSGRRQVPEQDNFGHKHDPISPVANQRGADYAKQLREQMRADSAAAQREKDTARLPHSRSTSPPALRQSLRNTPAVATGGTEAGVSSVVDRKTEYARQLREQMAADKAMKSAIETERKRTALPTSCGVLVATGAQEDHPRKDGSERVGGPFRTAKEEYAQQLREQMAAKEDAQRAAKGLGGDSNSSNTGPSWIEGATEGREARRKRSNAEYADQLRAQIATQKSNTEIEQSRIASWEQPPEDSFRQPGHVEEHQLRQEWRGDAARVEERRRGPEWQSRSGGQRRNQEEPGNRRFEGERPMTSFQGETQNALALDR